MVADAVSHFYRRKLPHYLADDRICRMLRVSDSLMRAGDYGAQEALYRLRPGCRECGVDNHCVSIGLAAVVGVSKYGKIVRRNAAVPQIDRRQI